MNKITKEICVDFLKNHYKAKMLFYFFLVIVALGVLAVNPSNVIGKIVAVVLIFVAIFLIFKSKHKIDNLSPLEFYLVEDVVVDFKKRFGTGKYRHAGYDYIYKFKKYGKFVITKSINPTIEIPMRKQKHVSELSVEGMSIQSCNEGDMFYLLISKEGRCERIINCFCKYRFDIAKEEFDCVDGKYYIKE